MQNCNILRRGWNEPEWQEKTNAILGNPNLQGIAWEFIPGIIIIIIIIIIITIMIVIIFNMQQ